LFDKDLRHSDAAVSVVEFSSPHPDKIQKIENGFVSSYLGKESMVSRQSLPVVYALNGAFYLTHRDTLVNEKTFIPKRTIPYLMPEDRSLNLDTMKDIFILESMLKKGFYKIEEY
jgi:CMP-N-acetylneuraminic acid synthetase